MDCRVAHEVALKLRGSGWASTEAQSFWELQHGPISCAGAGSPIWTYPRPAVHPSVATTSPRPPPASAAVDGVNGSEGADLLAGAIARPHSERRWLANVGAIGRKKESEEDPWSASSSGNERTSTRGRPESRSTGSCYYATRFNSAPAISPTHARPYRPQIYGEIERFHRTRYRHRKRSQISHRPGTRRHWGGNLQPAVRV